MTQLQLKRRQKSVQSLHSILYAMQVVTMVRMQRLKEKYNQADSYLKALLPFLPDEPPVARTAGAVVIALTSNRGLCGEYDQNIVKLIENFAADKIVSLGANGVQRLKRRLNRPIESHGNLLDKPNFEMAARFLGEHLDQEKEIYLAYNAYGSAVSFKPVLYRLFPAPEELSVRATRPELIKEPSPDEFDRQIFCHFLEMRFYFALLSSQLAEETGRMLAMSSSVENSQEILDKLVIQINKNRQAQVTSDLSEVVASAEALKEEEDGE